MSLKSRARRVQRERAIPYQRALKLVREIDEDAKGLARAEEVSLGYADGVVLDRLGVPRSMEGAP